MSEIRYLISDASKKVDVETHVLRYWEEELELSIPRNEMGHRYYTEFHIRLFCQIKKLKDRGYQLKAIKNALQQAMTQNQGFMQAASILEDDMARTLRENQEYLFIKEDKTMLPEGIMRLADYNRLEPTEERPSALKNSTADKRQMTEKNQAADKTQATEKSQITDKQQFSKDKTMFVEKQQEKENKGNGEVHHEVHNKPELKEKDGQTEMKKKGRNRKTPSAWERRNGITENRQDDFAQISSQAGDRQINSIQKNNTLISNIQQINQQQRIQENGQREKYKEDENRQKEYIADEYTAKESVMDEYGMEENAVIENITEENTAKEHDKEYAAEKNLAEEFITEERAAGNYTIEDHSAEECMTDEYSLEDYSEENTADKYTANKHIDLNCTAEKRVLEEERRGNSEQSFQEIQAASSLEQNIPISILQQDEKMQQFQDIMNHVIGHALEVNTERLSQEISTLVNERLSEEMEDFMRIRDERDEERFRQLDEIIRSYQRDSQGKAEAAAAKVPFFRKRWFKRHRLSQNSGIDF